MRRLVLVLALVLLSGCSSASDAGDASRTTTESTPGGTTAADEPSTSRELVESSTDTEVLGDQLLVEVFIAPDGSDGNDGATRSTALRTVGAALTRLAPGGVITFTEGVYPRLELIGIDGTRAAPIRIRAEGVAEFTSNDYTRHAAILVENSSNLTLTGLRARRSLWGVMVRASHNVTLRSFDVGDIGQEGIRIKDASSEITVRDSLVADTGRRPDRNPPNGEGIYIGTGSPGGVDLVDDVKLINNTITRTVDEAIDVKRPVTNIVIRGNVVSDIATHTSGAIVVHLNSSESADPGILIEQNLITNVTRTSPWRDGNCIVTSASTTIRNNVIHNCEHRGIYVRGSAGTTTIRHNTLIDTGTVAAIGNDGRGMQVVSENNLGAPGDSNRNVDLSAYVAPSSGDYRLTDASAAGLSDAPYVDVTNDFLGVERPTDRTTFGAIEADRAPVPTTTTTSAPPTTTTSPPPTTDAPDESAAVAPTTTTTRVGGGATPGPLAFADTTTTLPPPSSSTGPGSADDAATDERPELGCLADVSCEWAPFL